MEKKAVLEKLDQIKSQETISKDGSKVDDCRNNILDKIENELFTFGKVMDIVGNNIGINTEGINMLMKYIVNK
jgi:hypothetical protein